MREVKRMHQLRQDINEMTPEEADLSWCWLFLCGRSAGKSHSMSAAVHTAVRAGIKRPRAMKHQSNQRLGGAVLQMPAMAAILLTAQAATRTLSPANWHRSRARSTTAVQEVFQCAG
jgi:hypothetical protein